MSCDDEAIHQITYTFAAFHSIILCGCIKIGTCLSIITLLLFLNNLQEKKILNENN